MNKNISLPILITLLISTSCNNKSDSLAISKTKTVKSDNWKDHWEDPLQRAELLSNPLVHRRIKEYLRDSAIVVLTSDIIANQDILSEIKSLGDINSDGIPDSILIVPELFISKEGGYENGASVIFTDRKIPRIRVDVSCLHTDFIFPVADIDEDGIIELGKYYTSCASRFKGLELISLKQNEWKIKGDVTFDVFFPEPKKEERIKKIGLNKFQMREITSEDNNRKIDIWKSFEMK